MEDKSSKMIDYYIIVTEVCGHKYYLQSITNGIFNTYAWNGLKNNARQFMSLYGANEVRRIWQSHSKTTPIVESVYCKK